MRQVIIKIGEVVWRDLTAKYWPFPPGKGKPVNSDIVFRAEYCGDGDSPRYKLIALGYGETRNYGNGAIYANEGQFHGIVIDDRSGYCNR